MNYKQINETIAKHLGWYQTFNNFGWFGWKKGHHTLPECPDYQGSYDACREFEETLHDEQRRIYLNYITLEVVQPDLPIDWLVFSASPDVRCRAYLNLLGKL